MPRPISQSELTGTVLSNEPVLDNLVSSLHDHLKVNVKIQGLMIFFFFFVFVILKAVVRTSTPRSHPKSCKLNELQSDHYLYLAA